jgi:hypothetical protein
VEYLKPSFSVGISRGVKDQDDFAKRWEETFGRKKAEQELALDEITRLGEEQAQNELTDMYNAEYGPDHE